MNKLYILCGGIWVIYLASNEIIIHVTLFQSLNADLLKLLVVRIFSDFINNFSNESNECTARRQTETQILHNIWICNRLYSNRFECFYEIVEKVTSIKLIPDPHERFPQKIQTSPVTFIRYTWIFMWHADSPYLKRKNYQQIHMRTSTFTGVKHSVKNEVRFCASLKTETRHLNGNDLLHYINIIEKFTNVHTQKSIRKYAQNLWTSFLAMFKAFPEFNSEKRTMIVAFP